MKFSLKIVASLAAVLSCSVVQADPLGLVTGLSTTYNQVTQSGNQLTLYVNNPTPSGTATINNWSLELQIVPLTGATGTLAISNADFPTTGTDLLSGDAPGTLLSDLSLNNLLQDSNGVTQPAIINGVSSANVYSITNGNAASVNTIAPSGNSSLTTITLNSTNASGQFGIYAVNDNNLGSGDTSWANKSFVASSFTNLPDPGDTPANASFVQLGTITVVPEPGSMILAGMAGLGMCGYGWRRKKSGTAATIMTATDVAPQDCNANC
jgi:hypothetical protein